MLQKIKFHTKDWASGSKDTFQKNKGQKKLTMCKKCYTFYYKNSWHFYKPKNVELEQDEEVPVRFTHCAACLEEEVYDRNSESELAYI